MQPITLENASKLQPIQQATRGWISQIVWSPSGSLIASSSAGGVAIWRGSLESQPLFIKQHDGPVKSVAFAPNGSTLATASADTTVKVWDLRAFSPSMQPIEVYNDHTDSVEAVLIAGNGAVISGSTDGTVRVLRRLGKMTLEGHTDEVNALAMSHNHSLIASGGHDYTIRLWDTLSGKQQAALTGHTDWVRTLHFHPTEHILMSGSRDGSVRLWDVSDLDAPQQIAVYNHNDDVRAAAFNASGSMIACSDSNGSIAIWDVLQGEKIATLDKHTNPIVALAFHPKNHFLASGGGENTIYLWGVT